ncbi:unnamed protein product [Brachionus calyciflorus]|uniref:BBS1 n=1 Tax=Brachionus calyciflorus TaxID=104777 RepID=A0A813YHC7_9BILA|nr:unnamed protein product [Brachionus calyciflorus]
MEKEATEDTKKQIQISYDNDWLNAYYDPVAGTNSHSGSIELADILADGDNKLVTANYSHVKSELKLKVFKGASLIKENNLVDVPTAIISFFMDNLQPRVPAIGVASGSSIFVYKNLRPSFQFTLPQVDVSGVEKDIWAKAKDGTADIATMHDTLEDIRRGGQITLSNRSILMLGLSNDEARRFVDVFKNSELKRNVIITCLAKMNKSSPDEDAINVLLVGTELKTIYVIDTEAFTILATMECPHIPVFLNASGLFDVEFRVIAACRDGCLYTYKRGFKSPKSTIPLSSQIVGIEKSGKNVIVGCMDRSIYCYTTKGKKLWRLEMPADILTISGMEIKSKGIQGYIISLNNNEVHVYNEKNILSKFKTQDTVVGIKFGKFGREESNLIMTTRNGGLIIKILKRAAELKPKDAHGGPPEAQLKKLDIPKKTKLYVDQTTRERDNAILMHQTFQKDLYKFRIKTAKEFLRSLQTSTTPISTNPNEPLKINAQVQGIGPTFKLIVKVQNISTTAPSLNLFMTFIYDDKLYKIPKSLIELPILIPGIEYPFSTFIYSISNQLISDNIKVLLCKKDSNVPIITAIISMPVSEAEF